jgi:hypothetical protein
MGGEVPEFEVFAGASHQQTPQIQVFFTLRLSSFKKFY